MCELHERAMWGMNDTLHDAFLQRGAALPRDALIVRQIDSVDIVERKIRNFIEYVTETSPLLCWRR